MVLGRSTITTRAGRIHEFVERRDTVNEVVNVRIESLLLL